MRVRQIDDEWETFFGVASRVYREDPVWVKENTQMIMLTVGQLDSPQVLVAEEEGDATARLVLSINPKDRSEGWIGFFECMDKASGELILREAERRLVEMGAKRVYAPRNDNMIMGLQIDGFDLPQTVGTPHNPEYYPGVFSELGYEVLRRMDTFVVGEGVFGFPRYPVPSGFVLRRFDRSNVEGEVVLFNRLNREVFGGSPLYVPRTLEQERAFVNSFLPILDDDMVVIAETSDGRPAGFLVCLLDIYQMMKGKAVTRLRVVTIGVAPEFQRSGLGVSMVSELVRRAEGKYREGEVSWIYEDNYAPQKLVARYGGKKGRKFALMVKELKGTRAQ